MHSVLMNDINYWINLGFLQHVQKYQTAMKYSAQPPPITNAFTAMER